jgi:hypothetical protein
MSREEVARQLEWSISTIFRIETGRSRPQPGNVRALLEPWGVTGAERDGLIQLTHDARPRLRAVIDEAIIHRVVGNVSVMAGSFGTWSSQRSRSRTTIQGEADGLTGGLASISQDVRV